MNPDRVPVADKLIVVMSDIEMGAGGVVDDFPHSDWLAELFLAYNRAPYDELAVDLVFNGDTFDLLKTSILGDYPRHVDQRIATAKFTRVARAHPAFFDGVKQFLAHDKAPRRVFFVTGNHDLELLFPAVQKACRLLLGEHPEVHFPGFALRIGDVQIEHGSQYDDMFRVDEDRPFVHYQGRRLLNQPWGAVALLDVAIPLQPELHHFDRVKPRNRVFALVPELKDLFVERYWQYWTRDWLRAFFTGNDPVKRLDWTVFSTVISRFQSLDVDLAFNDHYVEAIHEDQEEIRTWLVGHLHSPMLRSFGNRRVLYTGALRNEYMLEEGGKVQIPLPKVYAEVFLAEGRTVQSQLVETQGPPLPPGYCPETLQELLPVVRSLLAAREQTERSVAEALAQFARER